MSLVSEPTLFESESIPVAPALMAIDLATDKTGCAYCGEGFNSPMVWTFSAGTKGGYARDAAILAELLRAVKTYRPAVILLEDLYSPKPGKLGPGFFSLAFLHGLVRHHLAEHAPLVVVNTSHIKIFALGRGSGAGVTKTSIALAIERRYRHLVTIADDNQADAFTMLAMARHYYGHPLSTVDGKELPKTHLRAVTTVTGWPVLNGQEGQGNATC